MTVVSSKEFATNQEKYFDLAVKEEVRIKRGKNIFHLISVPVEKPKERVYYEPDEDFYRSISADEFKEGALKIIDKIFAK
jgi:hypothetical protein